MIQIEKTSVHDQLNQATAYITNRKQIEVSLVEPIRTYICPAVFQENEKLRGPNVLAKSDWRYENRGCRCT